MGGNVRNSGEMRHLRHERVRGRVVGTSARPRLNVFRSLRYIYAQVIDDTRGHTVAACSSLEPAVRQELKGKSNIEVAKQVGRLVAQRAKEHGVAGAVFDRGGYRYHGRVKALAEGAREGGLEF